MSVGRNISRSHMLSQLFTRPPPRDPPPHMPSSNVLCKIYHWASLTPTDPTPNTPTHPHVGCEATAVNGPALRGHKYPVSSSGGLFGPHDSNQSVCSHHLSSPQIC